MITTDIKTYPPSTWYLFIPPRSYRTTAYLQWSETHYLWLVFLLSSCVRKLFSLSEPKCASMYKLVLFSPPFACKTRFLKEKKKVSMTWFQFPGILATEKIVWCRIWHWGDRTSEEVESVRQGLESLKQNTTRDKNIFF